jgi:hypothetical protein
MSDSDSKVPLPVSLALPESDGFGTQGGHKKSYSVMGINGHLNITSG